MKGLAAPMAEGRVSLEPLADRHIGPLRAACAEDREIWDIYPYSMLGEHFDGAMARRRAMRDWISFAVLNNGDVVGTTNYIGADATNGVVEIGGTYIAPRVRGGPLNSTMKALMIDRALSCGFRRIEFRVDTRNARSMAAVLKLGAAQEGVLRQNRVTWTGYLRDTAVFGLLADEWRASVSTRP